MQQKVKIESIRIQLNCAAFGNISQHLAISRNIWQNSHMLQFPLLPTPQDFTARLQQIELLSQVLIHLPVAQQHKLHIFHQQTLKSALFSAKIEGNTLSLIEVKDLDQSGYKNREKREISNVLQALSWLQDMVQLDENNLKILHQKIMNQLDADAGKFRSESSAIFDQYGNVVYLTPSPQEMRQMLAVWYPQAQLAERASWQQKLLNIACSHYYFEKIHPFLDGNGRTGRAVLQWQLQQLNLFNDFILPIEQFFDAKRNNYYQFLEKNSRQQREFVEFFLTGIAWSLEQLLTDIKESVNDTMSEEQTLLAQLLPRRREIFHIIEDHPYSTLDSIWRRFPRLPKRTLSYDLQQLVKAQLLNKHGSTKGVVYTAKRFKPA